MKVKESVPQYPIKDRYTYADYLDLPDDHNRYQIIDGELIVSPAPRIRHQAIVRELSFLMISYVKEPQLGEVYFAPTAVVFQDDQIVEPDILFISLERMETVKEKHIAGAPDLVVEVLSPSTAYYDLVLKKELYAKHGVKEYWIVDPQMNWIEIFVHDGDTFLRHAYARSSGHVKSSLLERFEVDVNALFSRSPKGSDKPETGEAEAG